VDGAALLEQRAVSKAEIQTGAIRTNVPGEWKQMAAARREALQRGQEAEFRPVSVPKVDE
jgi:hypothetical protein